MEYSGFQWPNTVSLGNGNQSTLKYPVSFTSSIFYIGVSMERARRNTDGNTVLYFDGVNLLSFNISNDSCQFAITVIAHSYILGV